MLHFLTATAFNSISNTSTVLQRFHWPFSVSHDCSFCNIIFVQVVNIIQIFDSYLIWFYDYLIRIRFGFYQHYSHSIRFGKSTSIRTLLIFLRKSSKSGKTQCKEKTDTGPVCLPACAFLFISLCYSSFWCIKKRSDKLS